MKIQKFVSLLFKEGETVEDCLDSLVVFSSFWPIELQKHIDYKIIFSICLVDDIK